MNLKCKFGIPKHGWLPFELSASDFSIAAEISDVPINPIDQLIHGLAQAIDGIESEVWLHLEPASYYLALKPCGEHKLSLEIEFSARSSQSDRKVIFEALGDKDEIVLPIWREIKEFASHAYSDLAWPETDKTAFEKLDKSIKDWRANRA